MTITTTTMTDEQRRSVALEFLKRVDNGGDAVELFAEDAEFRFPKWGVARGTTEITYFFQDLGKILSGIEHHSAYFNYVVQGDRVVVEGTSNGTTIDGVEWRAGVTHAGPWCDVFEIRDFKIQRLYVYLDPDYGDADTARYPWLANELSQ